MNGRTLTLALLASTALTVAGCSDSSSLVGSTAPVSGPLGLVFDNPVSVMSSDAEPDTDTVRVADDVASVTLNDLAFDGEGNLTAFSLTLGLPDGSDVTVTEADGEFLDDGYINDSGYFVLTGFEGEFGSVEILVGHGWGTAEDTDETLAAGSILALARVDPSSDADDGTDTYMVYGDVTETLPEGEGEFFGVTVATAYTDGEFMGDAFGEVMVFADFDASLVDILLEGEGEGFYYILIGNDLAMDGSTYGGDVDGVAEYLGSEGEFAIAGDLLGAIYGDSGEATAGVFGVDEAEFEGEFFDRDIEIVGGYVAYQTEPELD